MSKKAFKNKPHITSGIKVSIKYRNKLYIKYLNNRTAAYCAAWTRFKNKTTMTIRNAEKLYYKNLISSHINSSTNLWKTFGKIFNNKKVKNRDISSLLIDKKKYQTSK